jgi:hypothetical protein
LWGELHGSRQKKTFGCRVLDCFCCRSYIHSALGPYHLLYCGGTEGNHLGLVVKEGNARTSRLCCNVSWRCWWIGCRVSLWGVGDILNSKPLNSRTYFPTDLDIDVVHFDPFPPRDGMWTVVEPHGDSIWTIKQATEMEWTRREQEVNLNDGHRD